MRRSNGNILRVSFALYTHLKVFDEGQAFVELYARRRIQAVQAYASHDISVGPSMQGVKIRL